MVIDFSHHKKISLSQYPGLQVMLLGELQGEISHQQAYDTYLSRLKYINAHSLCENELRLIRQLCVLFGRDECA